jgi:Protein of unknown function (DUF3277)
MPAPATTYSFKDLAGVLTHPLLGAILPIAGGNIGIGQIIIRMITQRTEHLVAADGVVMPSYLSGANAEVSIEMEQTSGLHHALLNLYDLCETAAQLGDVSNWAAMVLNLRTMLDGSGHFLQGGSFQKITDKPYAARGQMVTWVLMFADCVQQ